MTLSVTRWASFMAILFLWLSLVLSKSYGQLPTTEARKKAEAVFKESFGKEFAKFSTAKAKEKLEYADKLGKVGQATTDTELRTIILEKAISLTANSPAGNGIALKLYPLLIARPDTGDFYIPAYLQTLEKAIPLETTEDKQKVINDLAVVYLQYADKLSRKDTGNPTPYIEKGRKLIKQYNLTQIPDFKDFPSRLENIERFYERKQFAGKEFTRLQSALAKTPADLNTRLQLITLAWKNNPEVNLKKAFDGGDDPLLSDLKKALIEKSLTGKQQAEILQKAGDQVKTDQRFWYEKAYEALEEARNEYEPPALLRAEQITILEKIAATESAMPNLPRSRAYEDLGIHLMELAEDQCLAGRPQDGLKTFQKGKQLLRSNRKGAELKEAAPYLDKAEVLFEKRVEQGRRLAQLANQHVEDPKNPKLNLDLGLACLQAQRLDDAFLYLAESDNAAWKTLATLWQDPQIPRIKKLDGLLKEANNLPVLKPLCRDLLESYLKTPEGIKQKEAILPKLLLLPRREDGPSDLAARGLARNILEIFDETPDAFFKLTSGMAPKQKPSAVEGDAFNGRFALKVPEAYYIENEPKIKFLVTEYPQKGQYRYLRFSWKKVAGRGAAAGVIVPGAGWRTFSAGPKPAQSLPEYIYLNTQGVPTDWETITIDLYALFGEFTFSGLSFFPTDGSYLLVDQVLFAQTKEDLRHLRPKAGVRIFP